VRYVLEGSVRKSGNRVRITGQLVEAATGDMELRECFEGGDKFIARVGLLSARKRVAEEAEASLALGKEAAVALAEVHKMRAQAASDLPAGARGKPHSVFGPNGMAIVIHASVDDYKTDRPAMLADVSPAV
jgi:hypothetical protein